MLAFNPSTVAVEITADGNEFQSLIFRLKKEFLYRVACFFLKKTILASGPAVISAEV